MPGKTRSSTEPKKRTEKKKSKGDNAPVAGPSKPKEKPVEEKVEELSSVSELDEDDDEGVNEEGMTKLMQLLGEDGLDDFGQMQLQALDGEGEESGEGEANSGEEDVQSSEEAESDEGSEDEEDAGKEQKLDDESDSSGDEDEGVSEGDDGANEVALEDAEEVDEDAVPQQKLVINNKNALERIRETIKLDPKLPWTETLVVNYPEAIDVDVEDDLNRELAFYKQALHCAKEARDLADQHKLPFTRPTDYFAEMVKSDAHMERVRQRLLDESAQIKKSEDKRKEREGKKFGKQVQLEKQKERERSKKEMEERLKGLKRKRKDMLDKPNGGDDDAFDVAVEDAISDRPSKRTKSGNGAKMSRKGRDAKFGFGGKGRRSKQNTRESTEQFNYGSRKGAGGRGAGASGKAKRLGKSRRHASKNR